MALLKHTHGFMFYRMHVIVCFILFSVCAADNGTENGISALFVQNLTNPGSLCNKGYPIKEDTTLTLTMQDIVDPKCRILLIGFIDSNYTYGEVCYNILDVQLPCGNNYVAVEELSVITNSTGPYLNRRKIYNYTCEATEGPTLERNESKQLICSSEFYFVLKIHVFMTEVTSIGRISLKAEKPSSVVKRPIMPRLEVIPGQSIDYWENWLTTDHHNNSRPRKELKTEPLDIVNNVITILGTVITTGLIPVTILLISRYCPKKSKDAEMDAEAGKPMLEEKNKENNSTNRNQGVQSSSDAEAGKPMLEENNKENNSTNRNQGQSICCFTSICMERRSLSKRNHDDDVDGHMPKIEDGNHVESNEEDSCNNRESGSGREGEEGELANKTLSDARPQTLSTTSEPLLQGRVVRKRTQPLPLDYRKRDETPPVRTGTMCADVGTQTETVLIKRLNDEGSQITPVFFTRRQETTTEYIEGGKKIRIVEIKEAI